jgi:hypothetical protein
VGQEVIGYIAIVAGFPLWILALNNAIESETEAGFIIKFALSTIGYIALIAWVLS